MMTPRDCVTIQRLLLQVSYENTLPRVFFQEPSFYRWASIFLFVTTTWAKHVAPTG